MKPVIAKIVAIYIAFLCSFIISSCKKSNLDRLPHGPTEQSFFTKEDDFNKAVIAVYAKMTDLFWYNGGVGNTVIPAFLLPGDDITTNNSNEEFEQFGSLEPNSARLTYLYRTLYQMATRANTVLQKINEVGSAVYTTPNLKNYNKGEALFLRGYAHYNLWNFFGSSPLDTTRVTSTAQFKPPGTKGTQKLLDQAIQDFSAAASLLPASWPTADRGRATANSAYGMLGKSLVFRASVNKAAADYTAAIAAFNSITGVSLMANFDDNFAFDTENNNESLFEFQASQAFGFDNVWLSNDFDNAIGAISVFWGFYENSFALFGTSPFFSTTKLMGSFDPADPRLVATMDTADRSIRKYVTRNKLNQPGASSVNNYRILRYADILLLKAEATLQSGGSTAAAIGFINQVRTRARNMAGGGGVFPADYSTAETDKTKIMGWIMKERFLELAGEGQRWFDIRRWQMQGIINVNNAFFSSNTANISFQLPKHLYFPIPNSEIDVNVNVIQNDNY